MLVRGIGLSRTNGGPGFEPNGLGLNVTDYLRLWADPHAASYYLNYAPPPEWLVGNVTEAVGLWRQKAGWTGPSSWREVLQELAGLGGGSGGLLRRPPEVEMVLQQRWAALEQQQQQ